jgi:hypothetical protein
MWENETVVLVTSLKKRILGSKEKVRFGKINADNAIPPFIKTLFQNRVEAFIVKELPLSVKATPHFDLQHDDIEIFRGRFLDVLREAASFSQKEVEDILRAALILRLDYLVKPIDTMRRMLFEKRESVELSEMEDILDPFIKVLPYADLLIKENRRLGYNAMERDEYGRVAADLLHRMVGDNTIKIILHDFSSLTDFLSETKGEEVSKVEGNILQEFLADRNQWKWKPSSEKRNTMQPISK